MYHELIVKNTDEVRRECYGKKQDLASRTVPNKDICTQITPLEISLHYGFLYFKKYIRTQ